MRSAISRLALGTALVVALVGGAAGPAAAREDTQPDVPFEEAVTVCVGAVLVQFRDALVDETIGGIVPEGDTVKGVVEVRLEADEILLEIERDGVTLEHPFELARLVTGIAGAIGGSGELFDLIGTPALYCLQAAFVVNQRLAEVVAGWLQAAWVEANYAGSWTGSVTQQDIGASYPVSVTIEPGQAGEQIGVGSYETLGCTVVWTLTRVTLESILVRETVQGGPECQDVDITLTRRSDGDLDYDFENGNGHAVLSRAG